MWLGSTAVWSCQSWVRIPVWCLSDLGSTAVRCASDLGPNTSLAPVRLPVWLGSTAVWRVSGLGPEVCLAPVRLPVWLGSTAVWCVSRLGSKCLSGACRAAPLVRVRSVWCVPGLNATAVWCVSRLGSTAACRLSGRRSGRVRPVWACQAWACQAWACQAWACQVHVGRCLVRVSRVHSSPLYFTSQYHSTLLGLEDDAENSPDAPAPVEKGRARDKERCAGMKARRDCQEKKLVIASAFLWSRDPLSSSWSSVPLLVLHPRAVRLLVSDSPSAASLVLCPLVLWSSVLWSSGPLSLVLCLLVLCPLSSVRWSSVPGPLSSVRCPLSVVRCPLSAVLCPLVQWSPVFWSSESRSAGSQFTLILPLVHPLVHYSALLSPPPLTTRSYDPNLDLSSRQRLSSLLFSPPPLHLPCTKLASTLLPV